MIGGSSLARADVIQAGCLIKKINGVAVSTLDEYREAFLRTDERDGKHYFTIETEDHKLVVLDAAEALVEEPEMAEIYRFPLSELVKKLQKKLQKWIAKSFQMQKELNFILFVEFRTAFVLFFQTIHNIQYISRLCLFF